MTDELEVELKYSVRDPDAVRAWLDRHVPRPAGTDWSARTVTDTYVDTADRRLAQAGYGARLRTGDERPSLTLKSDVDIEGALHRRRELQAEATAALEPSAWPKSAARELLITLAADAPLVERFVVRQQRLERPTDSGPARLLLSIDHVEVVHRGRLLGAFDGLEIELRGIDASALAALGRRIEASGLVEPERRSKLVLAETIVAAVGTEACP